MKDDYKKILASELDRRKRVNSKYSLRSFARDLNLQVSQLSDIFNGRKGLSESSAIKVSKKMKLSQTEQEYFIDLVLSQDSRSKEKRKQANERIKKVYNLRECSAIREPIGFELFTLISNWYYFPILELSRIKAFKIQAKSVSRALNISLGKSKKAIDLLKQLDLLKFDKNTESWLQGKIRAYVESKEKNKLIRDHHIQMLEKTKESFEQFETNERFNASETLAFSKEGFSEASKVVEECLEDLVTISHNDKFPEDVYQIVFHMFPLTMNKGVKK